MKLTATVIACANALSQQEINHFGCRDGTFYQYSVATANAAGAETDVASNDNGFNGCHPSQAMPCVKEELPACSVSIDSFDESTLLIVTAGVPDHNAWTLENNAAIDDGTSQEFRVPTVPVLKNNGGYTVANDGAVGFALNGVDIYSGANPDTCCDFAVDNYDKIDFCTGYSTPTFPSYNRYHYHFYPTSTEGYEGCLMQTCNFDLASPLVGVAKDGFPIYGPVQWYSASSGTIWNDPASCSDCELMRMDTTLLDDCNGLEVEDGVVADGSNFR